MTAHFAEKLSSTYLQSQQKALARGLFTFLFTLSGASQVWL